MKKADFSNKTVLMRVDWNLSLNGEEVSHSDISDVSKIMKSVTTIQHLFKHGARTVHMITHQGRPGSRGFTSTKFHADVLSRALKPYNIRVEYAGDFTEELKNLELCLKNQREGHVYVWDNIRKLAYESEAFKDVDLLDHDTEKVRSLVNARMKEIPLVKVITERCRPEDTVYINDAFATHHRVSHLSIGPLGMFLRDNGYDFFYGPTFNDELAKVNLLKREMNSSETNFFFGGAKIKDYVKLIPNLLNSYPDSNVFASGPLALALLKFGEGRDIGDRNLDLIEEVHGNGLGKELGRIYKKHKNRIHLPSSFMVVEGKVVSGEEVEVDIDSLSNAFVVDIGNKTIKDYEEILRRRHSSVNLINGGCGFHEGGFVDGTLKIFEHTRDNGSFVVVIGGDANLTWSNHAVDIDEPDIRSMAGKAFLNAIVHDEIPLKRFMET